MFEGLQLENFVHFDFRYVPVVIYLLTYMRVFVFGFVANGLPIGWSKLDKQPLA